MAFVSPSACAGLHRLRSYPTGLRSLATAALARNLCRSHTLLLMACAGIGFAEGVPARAFYRRVGGGRGGGGVAPREWVAPFRLCGGGVISVGGKFLC